MADEVVLDEEVITTSKKKFSMDTAEWIVSYRVKARRSTDLKYWVVREIEFRAWGTNAQELADEVLRQIQTFMASCNYNLFSVREFDGERKEKYD